MGDHDAPPVSQQELEQELRMMSQNIDGRSLGEINNWIIEDDGTLIFREKIKGGWGELARVYPEPGGTEGNYLYSASTIDFVFVRVSAVASPDFQSRIEPDPEESEIDEEKREEIASAWESAAEEGRISEQMAAEGFRNSMDNADIVSLDGQDLDNELNQEIEDMEGKGE